MKSKRAATTNGAARVTCDGLNARDLSWAKEVGAVLFQIPRAEVKAAATIYGAARATRGGLNAD